jgi:hypothetical protein
VEEKKNDLFERLFEFGIEVIKFYYLSKVLLILSLYEKNDNSETGVSP